jgi:hydrogenase nickel incorporation protein HypA/HybF
MHELSIAMSILDLAEEESKSRDGAVIRSIHLKLGPLSGVVKQALVSAFEVAREDSAMPNVELVIEEAPLVVFCPKCVAERTIGGLDELCCPECGMPSGDVISGRELEIVALEIET